ncbi:MAG: phosphatase PAP2 family protein [Phaeodactylibacter sp.]|nr:phosphatase PAP2 family protein [Phaeodactylibacter sp.]MCB9267714.1 phosphatase PAP2 family protein [Lewinellaceae bacterium]MCB9287451.1 phosphatase PAP2 family protein [Lewinellaceae bacterium]
MALRQHLVFWFIVVCFALNAQSVYGPVDYRDAWIGGGGAGLYGASFLLTKKVEPLSPEAVSSLYEQRDDIWKIDRWVTRQWSPAAQHISDGFILGAPALPLVLLLDGNTNRKFGRHALIAMEGMLLNLALMQLSKASVRRPRPFVFNPDVPLPPKLERDARLSFFSGHTSTVATMSFISARLYTDLNPDNRHDGLAWATASVLPAITGYLRVRGGKHYLTDVLVGYAAGMAIGLVAPRLHR